MLASLRLTLFMYQAFLLQQNTPIFIVHGRILKLFNENYNIKELKNFIIYSSIRNVGMEY